ncbi:MAG: hypothetical protein H0V17_16010 [Deltaproteobacteria bacterium]|nr:hypothetical protein [Deltaproteobacteria bacterium]
MTYRDDRDADRARVTALEAELAGANRRIAELEGKQELALVRANDGALALTSKPTASKKWLGAPIEMELAREFPGAFPTAQFEDLIEPIRTIARDPGRTEILKSSLTWTSSTGPKAIGPFLTVTVSVRDGKTKLAVFDKLGQAAGAVFGGIGGGVGGGTIFVPLALGITFIPVLTPVFMAAWLGGTWWGSRAVFKRVARRRATQLQAIFDALVVEIEDAIAKAPV